jgi:hypothetical protein
VEDFQPNINGNIGTDGAYGAARVEKGMIREEHFDNCCMQHPMGIHTVENYCICIITHNLYIYIAALLLTDSYCASDVS